MATAAANLNASAVNTIQWLSAGPTIVVPVYQRQYRWDIDGCEQLLSDIRRVADAPEGRSHFIGSILSSVSEGSGDELVLIDGQQRITTIMLLVAALQHSIREEDPALSAELEKVLLRGTDPVQTALVPHLAWAQVFERVVLGGGTGSIEDSRFDDNYAFFRSQIPSTEVERIWRGLQRLEHVSISLGGAANAQQIFESLNSTGAPLRDHELIHNYVLMGLTHTQQSEIENDYWFPIEQATGEAIGDFWRHFLVMLTGIEIDRGNRRVYEVFRSRFPRLDMQTLLERAINWKAFAEVYGELLNPGSIEDPEISRQLGWLSGFGRGMFPLLMRALQEFRAGSLSRTDLIQLFEYVQSMLLRRTIVGIPVDRMVARLCRAWLAGPDELLRAISRITPSDERVRVALKYTPLPQPQYVFQRLNGLADASSFGVDHVAPLSPADNWSADGMREWKDLSEDEQNSFRSLAPTLGNLVMIEDDLAQSILDSPFKSKQSAYKRSSIAATREIADLNAWSTAAIAERTAQLSLELVQVWPTPSVVSIDDDGLTPILDAKRRKGWPPGWNREFDYVEYRGEHWEVPDVKYLFNRVFKRLWADSRSAVVSFSTRNGGPLFKTQAWNGHWDKVDEDNYLYMGWDSGYMLAAVQGVLEEAGIAAEVFVKYSYLGEVL
ncbi:MAG: DUF262 domain-containing protein [Cryobacterium sp.]|nr:DUF262 domain-containing protein [Cryobacterium sp.]MBX3090697.1 DUF262 domain-containing protein [Cryobacterium sp.]MCO5294087.1 DUF262 domain-containing HNH endonuclease family protein [Homoserinimonas sp.]MCW5944356.1 DUF262 domain-containing protein [Cryobacterium sp.]